MSSSSSPRFPTTSASSSARCEQHRRARHGDRRAPVRLARRGAEELARRLRAGAFRHRRAGAVRRGAPRPGRANGSTASRRRSRPTSCPTPRCARPAPSRAFRAHGLSLPRQGGDEGGAAPGGCALRRLRRGRRAHRRAGSSPRGRLPADRQAAGRRRRRRHLPRRQPGGARTRAPRHRLGHGGAGAAIEEFIEGHEGFYDTLTIDGRVVHDFISHYYPNVLEAMRTRWISPQIVATNRMDAPGYGEVKEMGRRVIEALGIGTAATHMEWFFGPKGLQFSEIGCRPPGRRPVGCLLRGQRVRPLSRVGARRRQVTPTDSRPRAATPAA